MLYFTRHEVLSDTRHSVKRIVTRGFPVILKFGPRLCPPLPVRDSTGADNLSVHYGSSPPLSLPSPGGRPGPPRPTLTLGLHPNPKYHSDPTSGTPYGAGDVRRRGSVVTPPRSVMDRRSHTTDDRTPRRRGPRCRLCVGRVGWVPTYPLSGVPGYSRVPPVHP